MNIRKTIGLIGLCVCSLVGGNAYGQDIINTWIGEQWTNDEASGVRYIMDSQLNAFLKYESEGTVNPIEATRFTLTDRESIYIPLFGSQYKRYSVTFQMKESAYYVYEIDGLATWGSENSQKWHFDHQNSDASNTYKMWHFNHGDNGLNINDAREVYIDNEMKVSYIERKLNEHDEKYSRMYLISENQYNALYPHTFLREKFNFNKIEATGWDNPDNHKVASYKAYNGNWFARTETTGTGTKLILTVSGLQNKSYNVRLDAFAIATSETSDAVTIKANNVLYSSTSNPNPFTAQTVEPSSSVPFKDVHLWGVPVTDGTMTVTVDVNSEDVKSVFVRISDIQDGTTSEVSTLKLGDEYYVYNVGKGEYLEAGNLYGTQTSLGHGINFRYESVSGGENLNSLVSLDDSGNGYIYSDNATSKDYSVNGKEYVDGGTGAALTIASAGSNTFTISRIKEDSYWDWGNKVRNVTYYATANTSDNTVLFNTRDTSSDFAKWKFITRDQRINEVKLATVDNPKDATFLINDPDFSRNDTRYSSWISEYSSSILEKAGYQSNYNLQCSAETPKFNVYQVLSGMPKGLYLLTAQGYHYDENNLNPVFELYANDNIAQLTSGTSIINAEEASTYFSAGKYTQSLLAVVGDDGKLTIGVRCRAKDGNTWIDNFELTYYGEKDVDNMDVTTLFIKNPGFQGASKDKWDDKWTKEKYNKTTGNADNLYKGHGYYADITATSGNTISKAYVYQTKIYLPAGAYQLSALCVAQNNPAYLFVKDVESISGYPSDLGQHITFVDKKEGATTREVAPKERVLQFVVPTSRYVTLGYCNEEKQNCTDFTWNAVDNFKLAYLGAAKNTDISCQLVNPNFNSANEDLDKSRFGWMSLGTIDAKGKSVYNYEDFHNRTFGVGQIYNGVEDVHQTITGLPDGWYKVEMQAFYQDANNANNFKNRKNAFLYANNTYSHIQMINSVPRVDAYAVDYPQKKGYPHNLEQALSSFESKFDVDTEINGVTYKAGESWYDRNKIIARVTNGNLKVGILREGGANIDGADWIVFNNVRLSYVYNDSEIEDGTEFTQFIKNPSFETFDLRGWSDYKQSVTEDNVAKDLMSNGDQRYLANTGSTTKLGYYHIKQEISGTENGLPQGQYVLKAKVTSVEDNDIAVFVNGRTGSFVPIDGGNIAREIELGSIGVNNNERFEISFTSNYGFRLDDVRLFRSDKEGEGDALIVDLDGLIAQAKAILESGFVGDGAFQIDGDTLKTAYEKAVSVNANETIAYSEKKAAKIALVAAISAIQTATPKEPDPQDIYMIKHIASNNYLTSNGSNVYITDTPSKIQFAKATTECSDGDKCERYILSKKNTETNVVSYLNKTGDKITVDASTGIPTAFRIIFINGIPSHIALTTNHFIDGTCYGTQEITDGSDVYCNTDPTDGYSRWIITIFDPTIKAGEKTILYNLEAGAFIEEETYTPAETDLDGKTVVITDVTGSYTLAVKKNVTTGNEWDVTSHDLSNYNANQYLFAKFAKVTNASESGENLYTIQMLNAQGEYYSMWGNQGYLNFQPKTTGKVIFALGLGSGTNYGADSKNHGLWRVTYHEGLGYVIQNVGRKEYLDPSSSTPSSTPVYAKLNNKFLDNSIAEFGDDAVIWTVEADGSMFKLKNVNKYLNVKDDASSGIHSFMSTDNSDNSFALTSAGSGYDYNVYTMSMNPNNLTFGSNTYGDTYLGWSGESNYKPVLPLIASDDAEPRGIHWMKCSKEDYNTYKNAVKKARSARMNAWPVVRSAIRNGVSLTDFNKVYNNPMAVSGDIGNATATLREQVVNKVLHATQATSYDASYEVKDAECQSSDFSQDGWTVTGDITRHDDKPLYESIGGKKKMVLGGYYFESTTGNPASIKKELTGITPGKYALALDVNATKSDGNALNGLKIYIKSNNSNEQRAVVSGVTSTSSTITTPTIDVVPGETVTIGVEIESSNNVTKLAFDNFKLRYYDTYRKVESSTTNDITTFKFKGYWRGTENAEASKYINDKATENNTKDEAMSVVDMTDATIVNDMDLSFTGPKTGNVLVWTPADAPVTINGKDQNVIKDGKCTKFVITDNQTLNIPKAFKANEVEYTRKFATKTTKYSYATVLLPFALETNDDYQFYSLDHGNADGSFYIVREASSTAGIPSFVRKKNSSADDVTFKKVSVNCDIDVLTTAGAHEVESTDPDDNLKLVGSYVYGTTMGTLNVVNTHAANNYYYIKNDQFWRGNDWFYVDAFRAYIDATNSPSNVRACSTFNLIEWEMPEVDAIEDVVETDAKIVGYYSANGAPRQCLQSGLNIVKFSDGHTKKVYVK